MSQRAIQRAGACGLFLVAATIPSAFAAEQGLAVDLGASQRDALAFRASDGDGFAIFAPRPGGGFDLRLYPGQGPDVIGVVGLDVDGDGRRDLFSLRRDGTSVGWRGDGSGSIVPEPVTDIPEAHGGHPAAHRSAEARALDAAAAAETNLRLRALLDAGGGTHSDPLAAPFHHLLPLGDAISAASGRLAADAPIEAAAITPEGAVLFYSERSSKRAPTALTGLPEGFRARLLAFGRFGDEGEASLAVVGEGERPRLFVAQLSARGPTPFRAVPAPLVTVVVTVGSGGLSFAPSTANAQPGDTVQWTWATSNHTVTSGSPCTADNLFCSPSNLNCNSAPTSNSGAVYSRVFPTPGNFPYFCRPHCFSGMTGTVVVAAPAAPGTVPDGDDVPGVPLKMSRGASGTLDLSWGNSCSAGATNYAVYEGAIPIAGSYTHAALSCNLGNTGTANVVPGAGDRYYLVVPQTASQEGVYGVDRIGGVRHPIPAASSPCRPQLAAACP